MEPEHLKAPYGDGWYSGAAVSTPRRPCRSARPTEVRREVLERCEIFAPGGGFVFNSIHNVQAATPTRNLIAMLDAVREFNGDR